MNNIEFEITEINNFGEMRYVTHIYIDGKDIREIVKEVELPFATKEGRPKLAGDYEGIDIVSYDNCQDFSKASGKNAHILGCTCLETGCYSLLAQIKQDDKHITWGNFFNQEDWDYSSLKFIFDKDDYLNKVKILEKGITQFSKKTTLTKSEGKHN